MSKLLWQKLAHNTGNLNLQKKTITNELLLTNYKPRTSTIENTKSVSVD